jgi:hypothetical protein
MKFALKFIKMGYNKLNMCIDGRKKTHDKANNIFIDENDLKLHVEIDVGSILVETIQ